MTCQAVTYGHGVPAPCAREAEENGLCFYHRKMEKGNIDPEVDPTTDDRITVKRKDTGVTIGKGPYRARRRK